MRWEMSGDAIDLIDRNAKDTREKSKTLYNRELPEISVLFYFPLLLLTPCEHIYMYSYFWKIVQVSRAYATLRLCDSLFSSSLFVCSWATLVEFSWSLFYNVQIYIFSTRYRASLFCASCTCLIFHSVFKAPPSPEGVKARPRSYINSGVSAQQ